jgi:CMP-N-acetylneuraminic acid synthetase
MIAGLVIAKKHSNRLPGKNILPFCGLPLFLWSVIQSTCSRLIEKTFLSTDSEKIAELGQGAWCGNHLARL